MSLTAITVTETFLPEVPGGPVPSGYVEFELSERIHDGSGNEAEPEPINAQLSHVVTLATTATGGTRTLTWNGLTTATIAATASAATVLAALQALSGFPAGANASGGALGTNPVVITIPGDPAGPIVSNGGSLTGGTDTLSEAAGISQALYANDDTTTVPTGSYYTATFFITGIAARTPVEIVVPHAAEGATCTLASLS